MIQPHPFKNTGGKTMPRDERDYQLLGSAAEVPAVFMQEKAFNMPIYYQGKRPACGAHAGAWLKALLDEYEEEGQKYTPRYNWVDIKTFDGYGSSNGTDMRSVMKSLKDSGALDFDVLGNNVETTDADYANAKVVTEYMRELAAPNGLASYAFSTDTSFENLRRLIYQNKAVILLIQVGSEFWTDTKGNVSWAEGDVLPLRAPKRIESGHFVVAHSYDEQYIYFANSWSEQWGKKGHGWFGREYLPYVYQAGTAVDALSENVIIPKFVWKRDLYFGRSGIDVEELQKYLNARGFNVAWTGAGSPGHETKYYGVKTMAAVAQYQRAWGITPALGYFGAKTRAHVNERA